MDTEPRPACDGEYEIFFALIDTPGNMYIRRDAAKFCGTCPLRDTCLPENIGRGGDDEAWATAIVKELTRAKVKPCAQCGGPVKLHLQHAARQRYCSKACGYAAQAARRLEKRSA